MLSMGEITKFVVIDTKFPRKIAHVKPIRRCIYKGCVIVTHMYDYNYVLFSRRPGQARPDQTSLSTVYDDNVYGT